MKKIYTTLLFVFTVLMLWVQTAQSQTTNRPSSSGTVLDGSGPCGNNSAGGTTAFDTTVKFNIGEVYKRIKFAKFNATTGMLTCVKLIITMTGIVDTVAIQNYSVASLNTNLQYSRNDQMTGPGLTPMLSNSYSQAIGPATLSPYDGTPGTGPDFYSSARDTIFKTQMTRTLTDSTEISNFYGPAGDSVAYDYNIGVNTTSSIGGSGSLHILTSAFVNFRFEYCTCPLAVLPVGLKNFSVNKTGSSRANLHWEAETGNDHYFYQIEVSRDGSRFEKAGTLDKQATASSPSYNFGYAVKPNEGGRYYFRIKQQWLDGYYRYSEVRSVDFADPLLAAVSVYPNPSSGQAGIKFVAAKAGVYKVEVTNAAGQTISNKEMRVAETDFKQLNTLQTGTYYVKITELSSGASCVQQLVVR